LSRGASSRGPDRRREFLRRHRVHALAAFFVRAGDAEDVRPLRPRIVAPPLVGGWAAARTDAPIARPWRCTVPGSRRRVSPPPMMITCFPSALMTPHPATSSPSQRCSRASGTPMAK
jgi:hypothetical protein